MRITGIDRQAAFFHACLYANDLVAFAAKASFAFRDQRLWPTPLMAMEGREQHGGAHCKARYQRSRTFPGMSAGDGAVSGAMLAPDVLRAANPAAAAAVQRPIGKWEQLVYDRAERDAVEGPARGLRFDQRRADRAAEFFPDCLRLTTGEWAGQRFDLMEWQRFVVQQVFGWMKQDGTRRYRSAYIEVPRKNAKSTFSAGVGCYLLVADDEQGAQVYTAATAEKQARIIFDESRKMAMRSAYLRKRLAIQQHLLRHRSSESVMRPVSSQARTLDGLNSHGLLIDELHAHVTPEVFDVLETSRAARRQPLTVLTTTAGVYRPESIGWRFHVLAQQVLEQAVEDDTMFVFMTSLDEGDDWQDESVWAKANPSYSHTVKPDVLRQDAVKAAAMPAFQNTFRRLHLNEWTEQAVRWLDMQQWRVCGEPLRDLEARSCYGGLDLASNRDLTALALLFPDEDGSFDLLLRFWIPEDRIMERVHNDRVPYDAWRRDGWLITTPGNIRDDDQMRADINELGQQYAIHQINYDRWEASNLAPKLAEDGFTMNPIPQTPTALNAATKELDSMVAAKDPVLLRHGNHPVLNWMAANVSLFTSPQGYVKPDKNASSERIDGISAAVMAVAAWMANTNDAETFGDTSFFG